MYSGANSQCEVGHSPHVMRAASCETRASMIERSPRKFDWGDDGPKKPAPAPTPEPNLDALSILQNAPKELAPERAFRWHVSLSPEARRKIQFLYDNTPSSLKMLHLALREAAESDAYAERQCAGKEVIRLLRQCGFEIAGSASGDLVLLLRGKEVARLRSQVIKRVPVVEFGASAPFGAIYKPPEWERDGDDT